ncbi:hypothetical protein [Pseudoalteromonas ulvae]|uniref:Uncharacterized protein n=1 Tax=Pseudoalteromonas ulvae TaxID=107327 RepID=A0A244CUJ6_PSEDV|nr:hypothetical protein [Pseudoalteromonas ulvae]OUL59275.1 hypothetical protein B1199_03120 [Pseudoalteromonas ulvae]
MYITTTFEEYLTLVSEAAANYGAHNYYESFEDLGDEEKQEIKLKYESIDNFGYMTQEELEQQLKDYDDGYMGEDATTNDLMWFDGECYCCEATVEIWHTQSQSERGKWLDWLECAELVKERIVLDVFNKAKQL